MKNISPATAQARKQFCTKAGYTEGSRAWSDLWTISDTSFNALVTLCDPVEDNIMALDDEGMCIKYGRVGARGVRIEF